MKSRYIRQEFRQLRIRRKVQGTPDRPRLSVFRSLKHIYAQVINDLDGRTIASASTRDKGVGKQNGVKAAAVVGEALAKKAISKGISQVVFDRGGRPYHGQVKALAEGARQAGLKF